MAYVEIEKVLETARNGYHSDFGRSMADLTSLQEVLEDTPTADVMEVKQIEIIRDDLKWWLETNTEKGVVFIPKFVVENMIAKMGA